MGLPKILKKILPDSWIYNYELKRQQTVMLNEMSLEEWENKGKPMPPPAHLKKSLMKQYAAQFDAKQFIETGTFMGDTSFEMKDVFEKVDTIELDEKLANRAKKRFENIDNVTVWQGDSGVIISKILDIMPKSTVGFFYLDGHFSGEITAKADKNTPISNEIAAIFNHSHNHVIFIDDARLFFSNEEDYPPYDDLIIQIKKYNINAKIKIELDMILITSN
jgi:hypothetical protein